MSGQLTRKISSISLEQPPSLRRQEAGTADVNWILPTYVVGEENAALSFLFAKRQLSRLSALSPIVLYGSPGSGKTALAITLATLWSRQTDERPLLFTTGNQYADDFLEAIDADDIQHFRRRHRRCRLLVIDNLDALASKPAAQEELSANLDSMHEHDRPVIVTASRLPALVRGLRPPLASRLTGGYAIELALPAAVTRARIVALLAANIDPLLSVDELASFLAKLNEPLTAQHLLSIVQLASHHRKLYGQVDVAKLREHATSAFARSQLDINTIAKAVARRLRMKLPELRGSSRLARVVRARGLVILLARRLTGASLQSIGEYFGGRDHSTILHACRKLEESLPGDPELSQAMNEVIHELTH